MSIGCSEKIRKKDVVMIAGRWSSWSIQILEFLMFWWPVMKAGSTAMTQRPRDKVPCGSMLALPDPGRPDRTNPPTKFWGSFFWQHWYDNMHWVSTGKTVNKELCWGFKGVQERIPSEEASTLQIGSMAFPPGQCTRPQLHHCYRLFDQHSLQDSSSPTLQSRPCSMWLLVIP